jgi:SAM-dependent methyltransferase
MMSGSSSQPPEFDRYAGEYDAALTRGISVSGENKDYFAKGRVDWATRCLVQLGCRPRQVLDYGCGTGSATPFLTASFDITTLVGVDLSAQSIEIARRIHGAEKAKFLCLAEYMPQGQMDLAFCNGVFHHIPPEGRSQAVDTILRSLRPGGFFSFWENNPWNPGTRYVMSRIPFDRDAITLSVFEARKMLRAGGFEILKTDFLFVFPRLMTWFRRFEALLSPFPFGAQYQILCRKR